ncbi:hypothetical protein HZS_3530 [Henneguya salminicola]|nr:hypothetical protein HZS_3530 [Henneguya salminicola]
MSEASEFIRKCIVDDSLTFIDLSVYKARGSLMRAINQSKPGENKLLKAADTSSNYLDYLISPNCLSDTLSFVDIDLRSADLEHYVILHPITNQNTKNIWIEQSLLNLLKTNFINYKLTFNKLLTYEFSNSQYYVTFSAECTFENRVHLSNHIFAYLSLASISIHCFDNACKSKHLSISPLQCYTDDNLSILFNSDLSGKILNIIQDIDTGVTSISQRHDTFYFSSITEKLPS